MPWTDVLLQVGMALLYYAVLLAILRLAGKRLAGQTTTLDLVVLIALAVVIQGALLEPGRLNAVVFVVTVFAAHRLIALASARSRFVRELVRGRPVVLGYYFSSDEGRRAIGKLPPPVFAEGELTAQRLRALSWDGYGANLAEMTNAAMSRSIMPPLRAEITSRSLRIAASSRDAVRRLHA